MELNESFLLLHMSNWMKRPRRVLKSYKSQEWLLGQIYVQVVEKSCLLKVLQVPVCACTLASLARTVLLRVLRMDAWTEERVHIYDAGKTEAQAPRHDHSNIMTRVIIQYARSRQTLDCVCCLLHNSTQLKLGVWVQRWVSDKMVHDRISSCQASQQALEIAHTTNACCGF